MSRSLLITHHPSLITLFMAGTFNLQIVTPEREIFNQTVSQVTLPGMTGQFGVLRNHAPLVAALEPGLVQVWDETDTELRMVVGGGFFQVANNQAMILADSAELSQDIDVARAQEAERRARERLAGQLEPKAELQLQRAEASLKRAQARVRVASNR
jgi:F-type H+-transporting ATPase subunit epsilon